jgi:hypothetical protein
MATGLDETREGARQAARATLWRAILAILLGVAVVAAIAANKSGALPALPAKIVLGVTLPLLYGTSLAAIGTRRPRRGVTVGGDRRPLEDGPAGQDDLRPAREVEQVYRWRRTRLASLGVTDDAAMILAADGRFSVHEFERLLTAGCPLDTALRILRPA